MRDQTARIPRKVNKRFVMICHETICCAILSKTKFSFPRTFLVYRCRLTFLFVKAKWIWAILWRLPIPIPWKWSVLDVFPGNETFFSQAALFFFFQKFSQPDLSNVYQVQVWNQLRKNNNTKQNQITPIHTYLPSIKWQHQPFDPLCQHSPSIRRSFVPKHTRKKSTTRKTQNEEKGHVIRHTHRQLWTTNLRRKTKIFSHISFNSAKVPIGMNDAINASWMMQSSQFFRQLFP